LINSCRNELQYISAIANLLITMNNFSESLFPDKASIISQFPILPPSTIAQIMQHYSEE